MKNQAFLFLTKNLLLALIVRRQEAALTKIVKMELVLVALGMSVTLALLQEIVLEVLLVRLLPQSCHVFKS